MIFVSFACNNPDNGCFSGRVENIEIHGTENGCEIELQAVSVGGNRFRWLDEKPVDASDRCDAGFKIGRHTYGCRGYKYGVGNWCWDGAWMAAVDVRHLLLTLREMGWHCTAAGCDFYDVFNQGQEITPAILHLALRPESEVAA